MRQAVGSYLRKWEKQGYENGIPDDAPSEITSLGLAPSYKQIAIAILRNDPKLLGFEPAPSKWYSELKRIELGVISSTEHAQQIPIVVTDTTSSLF